MSMDIGISYEPGLQSFIPRAAARGLVSMVEVIPDSFLYGRAAELRTLLASLSLPYAFHYIGQSWGSADYAASPDLAPLVEQVRGFEPLYFSDHLTCCRSGELDLRQNISMPRRPEIADIVVENIRRCRDAVDRPLPLLLENVALNARGAADELSPLAFYCDIVTRSGAGCLLDVHNLVADETNFGFDPVAFITGLPPESITEVHIAGGTWSANRVAYLDSHLRKIPPRAFELLEITLAHARPRWVVFERIVGARPTRAQLQEVEADLVEIGRIARRRRPRKTKRSVQRGREPLQPAPLPPAAQARRAGVVAAQRRTLARIVRTRPNVEDADLGAVMRLAARDKYVEILLDALHAFFPRFMRAWHPSAALLVALFRGRGLCLDLVANVDQLHRVLARHATAELTAGFVDLLALERAISRCRRLPSSGWDEASAREKARSFRLGARAFASVDGIELVRVTTEVASAYPSSDPRTARRLRGGPQIVAVYRDSEQAISLAL